MSILRHFDDPQRPDNPRRRLYTSPTAERDTMTNKVTRANMASRDHGWLFSVAVVSRVTRIDQYDDATCYSISPELYIGGAHGNMS